MPLLLFSHILNNFWNELNHRLRVPYLEDVVDLQVGPVALEPLFSADIVLLNNFSELGLVKLSFDKTNNFTFAPIKLGRFGNLFGLLIDSLLIYNHLAGFVDGFSTEYCNLWCGLLIGSVRWHHNYVRLLACESFRADTTQPVLRLLFAGSLGHSMVGADSVRTGGIMLRQGISVARTSILRTSIMVTRVVLLRGLGFLMHGGVGLMLSWLVWLELDDLLLAHLRVLFRRLLVLFLQLLGYHTGRHNVGTTRVV